MRILDIDLDFFVDGAAHWKESNSDRLSADDYPPWPRDAAIGFLERRCKLDGKRPGFVVEHHAELFVNWRDAVDAGNLKPPFSITHVDAHADLGLGDAAYVYLMTELLHAPLEDRRVPKVGPPYGLSDGNWLTFAIACQWLTELVYVLNTSGPPGDLMPYIMEGWFEPNREEMGFAAKAANIEIAALAKSELDRQFAVGGQPIKVDHFEPKVPFSWASWKSYEAADPFDIVCLTRSPGFTPIELDPLFDEIRDRFIEEDVFR